MTRGDVEASLLKRIAESKAWVIYNRQPIIENWLIRSYPAEAVPITYIEDPETKRVEAWGMRFRVIFGPHQKRYEPPWESWRLVGLSYVSWAA